MIFIDRIIDTRIRELYAERAPLTRARRLGEPFDADYLRSVERAIDALEVLEVDLPVRLAWAPLKAES